MKKKLILTKYALFVVLLFGMFSCNRDDSAPTNNPSAVSGPFVAKVDGTQFATDNSKASAKFVASTKMLQVIGQTSDQKETIVFQLMPFGNTVSAAVDWKPGTYDFDPIHITELKYSASALYTKYVGSEYTNWSTSWEYVKNGKIIIESNTGTHIKGTFFFDTVKQNSNGTFDSSSIKKITEGSFDLDVK